MDSIARAETVTDSLPMIAEVEMALMFQGDMYWMMVASCQRDKDWMEVQPGYCRGELVDCANVAVLRCADPAYSLFLLAVLAAW